MWKFTIIFSAINLALIISDNPQPTPSGPAPSQVDPATCKPVNPSPANKDVVKVDVYFEAGIPDNLKYVKTILEFRKKLKDPNVLDIHFMVGGGAIRENPNGTDLQCPLEDETKYDCTADKILACVLDLTLPEKRIDTMSCVIDGTDPKSCGTQVCQIKTEDVDSCLQQNAHKLVLKTIDTSAAFQPPMEDYPSAVFDDKYDNCVSQKAFQDFATVFCAMLNTGKGDGACPTGNSGQQSGPQSGPQGGPQNAPQGAH